MRCDEVDSIAARLRVAWRKMPEAILIEDGMVYATLLLVGIGEQMSEPDGELQNLQTDFDTRLGLA
jgi:hypothetical protein